MRINFRINSVAPYHNCNCTNWPKYLNRCTRYRTLQLQRGRRMPAQRAVVRKLVHAEVAILSFLEYHHSPLFTPFRAATFTPTFWNNSLSHNALVLHCGSTFIVGHRACGTLPTSPSELTRILIPQRLPTLR